MNDHRATVGQIYEAFGRGDVPTILKHVADDVQWEYAWNESPMPWLVPGCGPGHVAGFFSALAEHLEFQRFELNHLLAGEGVVVALVSLDATVKSTGKHIVETDEAHIWYFDANGKIRRFRHAADTLQQFHALQH
jgi:uncharacterized protein